MATDIAPVVSDQNPLQVIGYKLDQQQVSPGQTVAVAIDVKLLEGFYAYADKFKVFSLLPDGAQISQFAPHPVVQFVDFSGKNHQGIEGEAHLTFQVKLPADTPVLNHLQYDISYIACTKKFCLPEKTVSAVIPLKPPSFTGQLKQSLTGSMDVESQLQANVIITYLVVFIFGVLASLTPCIYPLIPITLAVIGARAKSVSRLQAFCLSLLHVLGIATTYSLLGVLAAQSGALFGQALSYPGVSIVFAILFLAMGLSLFGLFEIRAPHVLTQKLSRAGNGKGFLSVYITGLVAGVIASPCVGPMLVSILAYIAKTQNALLGLTLLFTFALGMGVLLIVLGTFSSLIQSVPKSGPWMNLIKWFLGMVMILVGFYYGQLAYNSYLKNKSSTTFAEKSYDNGWMSFNEERLEKAKSDRKPVIIDFYADWCAACVELDHKTFVNPQVIQKTKDFILLRVDATESFKGLNELQKRYNVFGLPTIVCVSAKGDLQKDLSLLGFEEPQDFILRLEECRRR